MSWPRVHSAYRYFLVFNQTSNNFFETPCIYKGLIIINLNQGTHCHKSSIDMHASFSDSYDSRKRTPQSSGNETKETGEEKIVRDTIDNVERALRTYAQKHGDIFDFKEMVKSFEHCDRSQSNLMHINEVSVAQHTGWPKKKLHELDHNKLPKITLIAPRLSDVHSRVLRNTKCDLAIPRMRTAYGQNSFAFPGVDTWNKLHSDIKLAPSIQSFKAKLKAHNWKYSRKAGFNFPFFFSSFY